MACVGSQRHRKKKMALDIVGGKQRDQKLNMTNRQADKEQGKVKMTDREIWRVVKLLSVLLASQPSHKQEDKAPHFHITKFIIINTVGLLLRIKDWAEVLTHLLQNAFVSLVMSACKQGRLELIYT